MIYVPNNPCKCMYDSYYDVPNKGDLQDIGIFATLAACSTTSST